MTENDGGAKVAPSTQLHPDLVPDDEDWTYRCHSPLWPGSKLLCTITTQGGWDGFLAHWLTVHPDLELPDKPE